MTPSNLRAALKHAQIRTDRQYPRLTEGEIDAIIAAFKSSLDAVELPKEHPDSNVPSDRLNAQEDGEVMGWNDCLEEVQTAIEKYKEEL